MDDQGIYGSRSAVLALRIPCDPFFDGLAAVRKDRYRCTLHECNGYLELFALRRRITHAQNVTSSRSPLARGHLISPDLVQSGPAVCRGRKCSGPTNRPATLESPD